MGRQEDQFDAEIAKLKAEIARLRARLESPKFKGEDEYPNQWEAFDDGYYQGIGVMNTVSDENDRLQAVVNKLRTAARTAKSHIAGDRDKFSTRLPETVVIILTQAIDAAEGGEAWV